MTTDAALKAWETRRLNGTAGGIAKAGLSAIAAKRDKAILLQMTVTTVEARTVIGFAFTTATGQPMLAPENEHGLSYLTVESLLVPVDTGLEWQGHLLAQAAFPAPATAAAMVAALAVVKGVDGFLAAATAEADDTGLETVINSLANHVRANSVRFRVGGTDKTVTRGQAFITAHKLLSAHVEHVLAELTAAPVAANAAE